MRPAVEIRPGAPDDADRLAVLGAQVWMHTYATDGVSQVVAAYVMKELSGAALLRTLTDATKQVAVASQGDSLLGYAVVGYRKRCPQQARCEVELAVLHVQEHFARQGIGSALLDYAERAARNAGSCLWLTVNAQNLPAMAFYAARGYQRVGTAYFELGPEKHENHVLVQANALAMP